MAKQGHLAVQNTKGLSEKSRTFTFTALPEVGDLSPSWEGALLVAFGYTLLNNEDNPVSGR